MDADEEKFFDEQVAPLMSRVMELCRGRGIALVAAFEFSPEKVCTYLDVFQETTQSLLHMAAILYPERFASVPMKQGGAKA